MTTTVGGIMLGEKRKTEDANWYAKVGTTYRQLTWEGMQPDDYIKMDSDLPEDGHYIAGDDGSWIKDYNAYAKEARLKRDAVIDRVSRETERLIDSGEDVTEWRKYRQLLRDIPDKEGFPYNIDWGELPADFTGK